MVSKGQRAQIQYDQNVRPLIVHQDIDLSENGSINDKRQVQCQCWVTIGYTLFISIASWLIASERNKAHGIIPLGAKVTAHGELAGERINMDSLCVLIMYVIQA